MADCLTPDQVEEYYRWIDCGKPTTTLKRDGKTVIVMDNDGTKLKMFEDYEEFIGSESKVYKSMAQLNKQTREEIKIYVDKKLTKQEVIINHICHNVDNNTEAILGLKKKGVTSELITEKLIELHTRQQASLNNLREFQIHTQEMIMEELIAREITSKELIIQRLDPQKFALNYKTAWLTKEITVKILQGNKGAMTELKEYLIKEINQLSENLFKTLHQDFRLAIKFIKLIPENDTERKGLFKVIISFYTEERRDMAHELISEANNQMSDLAGKSMKSRTKREMNYQRNLHRKAELINKKAEIKNKDWHEQHTVKVIGRKLMAVSNTIKRKLPTGKEHEYHMQITDDGKKDKYGKYRSDAFKLVDDDDYCDDANYVHPDMVKNLVPLTTLQLNSISYSK